MAIFIFVGYRGVRDLFVDARDDREAVQFAKLYLRTESDRLGRLAVGSLYALAPGEYRTLKRRLVLRLKCYHDPESAVRRKKQVADDKRVQR